MLRSKRQLPNKATLIHLFSMNFKIGASKRLKYFIRHRKIRKVTAEKDECGTKRRRIFTCVLFNFERRSQKVHQNILYAERLKMMAIIKILLNAISKAPKQRTVQ